MIKSILITTALITAAPATNGFVAQSHGRIQQPRQSKGLSAAFMDELPPNALFSSGNLNNRHSASDWLYNVRSLPKSSVLKDILNPVLSIAAWSGVVSIVQKILASSSSTILQTLSANMCIGATPHSFLVSSLGLLLVFRTNSAYQRFYEGRKIWENILSISRSLSRFINLYDREVGNPRKQRILNLVAAFPYLLRHHIRPGCLCDESIDESHPHGLLLKEPNCEVVQTRHEGDKAAMSAAQYACQPECYVDKRNLPWSLFPSGVSLKRLARAQNRPLWVCDRIAREIMDIPYGANFSSRERLALISMVEKLTNTVGQCERIHQTAVPLNYARHSLRSLTLWCITLPFALVKDLGLMTGPVMGIVAWLLFGVYQIGYSIEDPFQGSLRLSILCDAIRRDVIGDSSVRDTAFDHHQEEDKKDSVIDLPDIPLELLRKNPVTVEALIESASVINATAWSVGI